MITYTKRIFSAIFLIAGVCLAVNGQTNVSGGIYSNTTWTLSNSPYVIVDTTVIFPGVTLTIQPGVVVEFSNDVRLEIRQARLLALGTTTDSITFTSTSITPSSGIWSGIYLNSGTSSDTLRFNCCNFKYADVVLNGNGFSSNYSLVIKNSSFRNNNTAITSDWCSSAIIDSCTFKNNVNYGIGGLTNFNITGCKFLSNGIGLSKYVFLTDYARVSNSIFSYNQIGISDLCTCVVENCTVKHNQYGITDGPYGGSYSVVKNCSIDSNYVVGLTINSGDTILNNKISHNPIGLSDSMDVFVFDNIISKNIIENNGIGIKFFHSLNQVYCNKISNNTTYDLFYDVVFGSNLNAENNFWSTPDSVSTTAKIYDGYDNITLGLVHFMPLDTEQCYLENGLPTNAITTLSPFSFNIFPNPVTRELTITLAENNSPAEIRIFNPLSELEYSSVMTGQETGIDVSFLANGFHILQLATDDKIVSRKFIKR